MYLHVESMLQSIEFISSSNIIGWKVTLHADACVSKMAIPNTIYNGYSTHFVVCLHQLSDVWEILITLQLNSRIQPSNQPTNQPANIIQWNIYLSPKKQLNAMSSLFLTLLFLMCRFLDFRVIYFKLMVSFCITRLQETNPHNKICRK